MSDANSLEATHPKDPTRSDASDLLRIGRPKYDTAIVLCKDCQKRGSGPSKLKTKKLRQVLLKRDGPSRSRIRVLESKCLGLCPKKAIAALAMTSGGPLGLCALHSTDDGEALKARLAQGAESSRQDGPLQPASVTGTPQRD